jgi:hypothetical protein
MEGRTMNETDTPRTDEMREAYVNFQHGRYTVDVGDVFDFARKLERELTAATEQRDEARKLAEKYRYLSCDSLEEADETLLPWEITTPNKQNDDNKTTR